MMEHHLGVKEMVVNLSSASGVGKECTVLKLVEEVNVDQAIEIQRMWEILEGIK